MEIRNINIITDDGIKRVNITIEGEKITSITDSHLKNMTSLYALPGLVDVHVHLREPGLSHKETIKTGTASAAAGGYTTVCAMPNVNPVPSNMEALQVMLTKIKEDASIEVIPYGSITKSLQGKELSNFNEIKDSVCAFTDDGVGVQSKEMMKQAMIEAAKINKMIVAHCEDNQYIESDNARAEWEQVKRDIELAKETGVHYHICHISTKESVEFVRKGKADGVKVTCEVSPHHLLLTRNDVKGNTNFKMNPPLREDEDVVACINGILDGTIDMIATDHAPHTEEEKAREYDQAPFGIIGFETAFNLMYKAFVSTNLLTLNDLIDLMSKNPSKIFNLKENKIAVGEVANMFVIDLKDKNTIDKKTFLSKARNTPFDGVEVDSRIVSTYYKGKKVYNHG